MESFSPPIYFSCLGECCDTGLLWSSRNLLWTKEVHLTFHLHSRVDKDCGGKLGEVVVSRGLTKQHRATCTSPFSTQCPELWYDQLRFKRADATEDDLRSLHPSTSVRMGLCRHWWIVHRSMVSGRWWSVRSLNRCWAGPEYKGRQSAFYLQGNSQWNSWRL